MQASCPNCSQKITIDDARVPDRPFSVKCPKCQTVVKFPGKTAAAAAAAAPPAPAPPPPAASSEPPGETAEAGAGGSEEMRSQMMAQVRREMGGASGRMEGRVLVALPERGQAAAITVPLSRMGFTVDTLDNADEGGRLLDQGVYKVVVTSRAVSAKGETLYQRITRLNPEARRGIFLVVVGDDLKTGDGTQAFAAAADLAVNPRDLAVMDVALTNAVGERARLYQAYSDARKRFEAATQV
ncbi:MAG TPA: zinc-ribbon domain-containing protein [Vicinamibacteria bacterium]|nr:zinc-ribbon domain-containing protein [Vicinamibacteria bacterium]